MFRIVEKENPLAVHGLFDTLDRAERHLREVIPDYVARGFFMDKSLTPDSFRIEQKLTKEELMKEEKADFLHYVKNGAPF